MPATRQTLALLTLTAAALGGCASSTSSTSTATNAVTGSMILTLEDDHGFANTRETLTMLQLPLPGLGASQSTPVAWSQIETRATADWSAEPVAYDNTNKLALVAGETGITLVSTAGGRIEHIADIHTDHPIASVSLTTNGLAAALSQDGVTLHIYTAASNGLTEEATFPLAIALGENSSAIAALFSIAGDLAVLDAGRSAVALFRANRSFDGSISLDKQWEHPTARGLTAGAWSPDGQTLAIAQRMLDQEIEDQVDILTAPGRISFITAETGQNTHTMLPGSPHSDELRPPRHPPRRRHGSTKQPSARARRDAAQLRRAPRLGPA